MKVVFRVDASIQIGTGHVMRCLTLAGALRENGAKITFICREHSGHLLELIASASHRLIRLPARNSSLSGNLTHAHWLGVSQEEDARQIMAALKEMGGCDWLIADHYALDATWETVMRSHVKHIMVIDDLADRRHDCDLLLDQNFYGGIDARYDGLVSSQCRKLLGPRYAMLRSEFSMALPKVKVRVGQLKHILVFFGATDHENETLKALHAIQLLNKPEITVNVVLGVNHPFKTAVREFASVMNQVICHEYVDNMAELMLASDLYLGAAGTTTWERCCLGLPSLVIAVASNQVGPIERLDQAGIVRFMGEGHAVSVEDISRVLGEMIATPPVLAEMSRKATKLVDGGGTQRCVLAILNDGGGDE